MYIFHIIYKTKPDLHYSEIELQNFAKMRQVDTPVG